jgi:hypothetical protein
MQLELIPFFQADKLPKEAIPYSSAALRQDLERLRGMWDDCQASFRRQGSGRDDN